MRAVTLVCVVYFTKYMAKMMGLFKPLCMEYRLCIIGFFGLLLIMDVIDVYSCYNSSEKGK